MTLTDEQRAALTEEQRKEYDQMVSALSHAGPFEANIKFSLQLFAALADARIAHREAQRQVALLEARLKRRERERDEAKERAGL